MSQRTAGERCEGAGQERAKLDLALHTAIRVGQDGSPRGETADGLEPGPLCRGLQTAAATDAQSHLVTLMDAFERSSSAFSKLHRAFMAAQASGAPKEALVEGAAQIPKAARRIVELARSANRLALNASIEAERAAQAGGFRVARTEMDELAEEIRTFARSIDTLMLKLSADLATGGRGSEAGPWPSGGRAQLKGSRRRSPRTAVDDALQTASTALLEGSLRGHRAPRAGR